MIAWRPASFRFLSTIAMPGCAGDVQLNLRPKKYPPSTLSHIPRTFFSAVNIFNRSVALLNRSMPSTAGVTIGTPPARAVNEVYQREVSSETVYTIYNSSKSIPDGERFLQALNGRFLQF